MSTPRRTVAAAAALALTITACAGDDPDVTDDPPAAATDDAADDDAAEDDTADETTDETADDDAAEDEDAQATDDGAGATLAVDNTDLGAVLVDGEGRTLYMFEPDEQGASQCYDDCEANWPPLLTEGEPVAEAAVDPELVGTAERDDGSTQVTYDGWPLYHFIGDQAAGDVAGQGVNEVWWVLDPEGMPVRDSAEEEAEGRADY